MPTGLDIGGMFATLGVDTSQLKSAEAGLQQFDSTAQSTFSNASSNAAEFGNQLMALAGISLSVAAAIAIVKNNIEAISAVNLQAIAGAAMMVSKSGIAGIDDQKEAYGEYYTYMKQMYTELNKETANHFASGQEMIMTQNALVQQGIYATQEEAKSIGVITDAVKLLHAGSVDEGTMMHEIMGLTQGHASIRFKLALQLKNMLGENWKEQVQQHLQEGDFVTWLGDQYKGLAVAQEDIQNNLTAQASTYGTLMAQIGKGGFGGMYEDIVGFVKLINEYLTENKSSIMMGVAASWQVVHDLIAKCVDLAVKLNSATSMAIPSAPEKRTFGQQTAVNFSEAFWGAPSNLVNDISAGADVMSTFVANYFKGMAQSATIAESAMESVYGWIHNTVTLIEGSSFIKWAVDSEGLKKDVQDIEGRVSWLVDIFSRALTWVINIKLEGLPSWLGGGPGATPPVTVPWENVAGKAKVDFGGQYPEGAGVPYKPMPNYSERLKLSGGVTGEEKYFTPGPTGEYMYQTTPTAPPPSKPMLAPEKGTAGTQGTEAAADRVRSIMETLDRELAKINDGSMAESAAWATKMIGDLDKLEDKGADVSEAIPKVWQVALAKTTKLNDDFNKWYAGSIGDNYAKIKATEDDKTKNFVMNQETMETLAAQTGKSMVDLVAENENRKQMIQEVAQRQTRIEDISRQSELINLSKQYYDQMAQVAPTLDAQNLLKQKSLDLEGQLAYLAIDKLLAEKKYLEPLRDQLYAQQAMVNQAKQFNLQMQQGKGVSAWAWGRSQTADQRDTVKDFLNSFESSGASSMSEAFYATLANDKSGLQKLSQNMGKTILGDITSANWTMLWDKVAHYFKPDPSSMVTPAQQAGQVLSQSGISCGQNILSYVESAAVILREAIPGGIGGQGGGGLPTGGAGLSTGAYDQFLKSGISIAGSTTPGSVGGAGGSSSQSGGLGGITAVMAQFAGSVSKFAQGSNFFLPGSNQFANAGVPRLQTAAQASQQSADLGIVGGMQLGIGAAGLGLGAVALATNSQALMTVAMILQTAAVALQVAAALMGGKSGGGGSLLGSIGSVLGTVAGIVAAPFTGGMSLAETMAAGAGTYSALSVAGEGAGMSFSLLQKGGVLQGPYTPIASFASGSPRVSAPTLAWVGEGPNEEAVIPLQGGAVPVKLGGRQAGDFNFSDNSSMTIGNRTDVGDFKQALRQHRSELVKILREEHRKFTKVG